MALAGITVMLLLSFAAQVYTCTSDLAQYKRKGDDVTLQFQKATTVNSENPDVVVTNMILSTNGSKLLTVIYLNGNLRYTSNCNGCTITGNIAAGDLTVRIDNIQMSAAGTYKHAVYTNDNVLTCVTLYVLGIPTKPTISANKNPANVEESVKLTCTSTSTTTPSNHGLSLTYSWTVDNTVNPSGFRYTYSGNKRTLTVSDIVKEDSSKHFTCTATENVNQGYTSTSSDSLSLNVLYGPDNLTFNPSDTTYTREENTTLSSVTCDAECNPTCTFKWTKIGQGADISNSAVLRLGKLANSEAGTYRCTATRGGTVTRTKDLTVSVIYGPRRMYFTPTDTSYMQNEHFLLPPITCKSECWDCEYSWKGPNFFSHTGPVLSLGRLTKAMAGVYTCTAGNIQSSQQPQQSKEVKLEVRYGPDVLNISVPSPYTVTEGEPIQNITCSSDCYPECTISWKNETAGSNSLGGYLTLGTVNRYMAGIYTCTGRNTDKEYTKNKENNVTVIVNYPPDVHAFTQNTTVKSESVLLTCNASGVPNYQYKFGQWIQKWPGTDVIVKEYSESPSLVLDSLTYEHSGVYSCSASNGIKVFGTDKEYMEGSVQLLVKSYPVILDVNRKVSGRLGENVTIKVDYYSNVNHSTTKCHKHINDSSPLESITAERYEGVSVNLPVFSHSIKANGTRAFVTIRMNSKEDFGFYEVVVNNSIDAIFQTIEIIPRGPPSKPYNVTVDEVQYESASLSWKRGYHGGAPQTFVVEVSTDLSNWEEKETVFDGLDESEVPISTEVKSLHGSTLYYLRMYAFNREGNSSYTAYVNFTTLSGGSATTVSSALIGGVAGGVSGVVVIVIAVVAVVHMRHRNFFTKGKKRSFDDASDRKPVYHEEDSDFGMQDNPMYVSAGPRNSKQASSDGSAEYSTVNKTKLVTSTSTGVYAEVDRTKKNKPKQEKKQKHEKSKQGLFKEKKGKKLAQEGDIYENASTTELQTKKANSGDKNEPVKDNGKKNVNKDGLIYADLAFSGQPKDQRKLVIHGLDDMTEYVQVDFTKKADPLPDSDDESSTPKN